MKFYWFVLGFLTVWRITFFFRPKTGHGDGFWAKLLDCFYCLSIWIAAPIAYLVGQSWLERAVPNLRQI